MRVRWYHYILIWLAIAGAAWRASPMFMLHVVGPPVPGTFEQLTGTIRVVGTETRTTTGVQAPKYLITTAVAEREFHCGFRVHPWPCLFSGNPGLAPRPNDVYTIGYHWYWGVSYMRHPQRLAAYDQNWQPDLLSAMRKRQAGEHSTSLGVLTLLIALHIYIVLYGRRSAAE